MDIRPVPDDHLMESRYEFAKPDLLHARQCFERIHGQAEKAYHGNGVWGDTDPERLASLPASSRPLNVLDGKHPPLYRNTAWRTIGYSNALKAEDNELYRQRLFEGGEYLLEVQQEDGSYLYWRGSTDGHPHSRALLFCSANPGCALLDLYRISGDGRFLDASKRAVEWSIAFEVDRDNNNYNSFAIWHQCEHYAVTGDVRCLESAIRKTVDGVYIRQLPNGAWAGHNSWIFYHSMIIRGMAVLYGLLPDGHKAKPELRRRMLMALNHLIQEQRENGSLRSCFDPEEWGKSRPPESAYSVHAEEKVDAFAIHALILVQERTDLDVSNVIHGLLSAPPQDELVQGQEGMMHLAYGVGYAWIAANI